MVIRFGDKEVACPIGEGTNTQPHIISLTNGKRRVQRDRKTKRGIYSQGGFHVVDVHGFCGHDDDYDMVVMIKMIMGRGVSLQGIKEGMVYICG